MTQFRGLQKLNKDRHAKAYAGALFAGHYNEAPHIFTIPGSNGGRYVVALESTNNIAHNTNTITCLCHHLEEGFLVGSVCRGSEQTVCYHSLAAVIKYFSEQGKHVLICDTDARADKILRLKGDSAEKFKMKTRDFPMARSIWVIVY
jgi:hypothetical protein